MPVTVLGLDPGFSTVGWALVQLFPKEEKVVAMGLLRTEKSAKVRTVRASDDNLRRAGELSKALRALVGENGTQVTAVCAETMSFPRNAGSAAKMSLGWGVIACLATLAEVPVFQASPAEIKKVMGLAGLVTGKTEAERMKAKALSKKEVQKRLRERYGEHLNDLVKGIPASLQEHPYDALAAVVACLDAEGLKMARRMAEKTS
jgi:Holliday junction resolvasome RuvABC endonuclease subunit